MLSDLYSVSPIADKTMSSKLAKDKATKGFCIGFGLPFITVTMEGGGDFQYLGPMLLFSTAFVAIPFPQKGSPIQYPISADFR